jgi:hypothetical protein
MRSINCQNIRSEIESAGSADYLSSAAMAHIDGCAACETLSRQQNRLHSILANLGTVEAPGDFDFKLRARLAAEKGAHSGSFSFLNFSFGARAAAAMIFLVIGAGIVFLNLKPDGNQLAAGDKPNAPQSVFSINEIVAEANGTVNDDSRSAAVTAPDQIKSVPVTPRQFVASRGGNRRNTNSGGSVDSDGRGAQVINANQLAETYPSAPFPINASGKRLKVSVADGRGAARTISLPGVSVGSESGLSQNPTPLMASARGAW